MSSTFHLPRDPEGFNDYGRHDNPTPVEEMLSHLEDAPCVSFPSGMAAITAVLISQLKAGARMLSGRGRARSAFISAMAF
jgi:cystathionine gamma-lyase